MSDDKPLKCFIGHCRSGRREGDKHEIAGDLLLFAIPHFGVIFRCRAEGDDIDLEFGAFFSLLQFLRDNLKSEKIKSVVVESSEPQFIFAFTGRSRHLQTGDARHQLLTEFSRQVSIQVAYVRPNENPALGSAADIPSLPPEKKVQVEMDKAELHKISFEPIRRGIKL